MSREDESAIQKVFVDQLGAKYPIVKIDPGDSAPYGITAYPSVYVIAPDGTVYSTPAESMPDDGQLEELLKTVSLTPKMPDDARFDPLRALWKKAEYAKVRDYLDKNLAAPNLDAAMKDVFTAQREHLQQRIDAAVARAGKLGEGPDYAFSEVQLDKMSKQWKSMVPADAAAKELARFGTDPTVKKELAAGRALQKLFASYDQSKVAQRKKLIEALPQFRKKYEGTWAAGQAEKEMTRLAGMK